MAGFGARTTAEEASVGIDLTGKTALVTGANAGLGVETARVLALRGAHVVMACRDLAKADQARQRLMRESGGRVPEERLELMRLDLSSLDSIHRFAREYVQRRHGLHVLVNNAGVLSRERRLTQDGFESQFGINHLGHFLLTTLLLDTLEASAPSRVVMVSSDAMFLASLDARLVDLNWEERSYRMWKAYGDSKLMNLMFARELDRRVRGTGIVAHAVHPGIVATDLARDRSLSSFALSVLLSPKKKNVAQGAASTVVAATAPEYGIAGGAYLADCQPHREHRLARDPAACRRLWEISERLVAGKGHVVEHSLVSSFPPRA